MALPIEPVRHFDQKRVRGMYLEQPVDVTGERARAFEGLEVLPPLRPHEVERGTWTILPADHGARVECLEVEGPGIAGDGSVTVRREAVRVVRSARVHHLPHVRIRSLAPDR